MENRFFNYALAVSLAIHLIIAITITIIHWKDLHDKPKNLEVTFQVFKEKKVQKAKDQIKKFEFSQFKPQPEKMNVDPIHRDGALNVADNVRDVARMNDTFSQRKIATTMPDLVKTKKITISEFDVEKELGPDYEKYAQQIRAQINTVAYQYAEDPQIQNGEIYVTFLVSSDGMLKEVKVLEDRSRANAYLLELGERIIQKAAPFDPFPKELKLPERTFKIKITYNIH